MLTPPPPPPPPPIGVTGGTDGCCSSLLEGLFFSFVAGAAWFVWVFGRIMGDGWIDGRVEDV